MSEAMRAAAIERAAEGEGDMPERLTAPEQLLFLSLRLLSRLENWKIIPEERAGREKTKIKINSDSMNLTAGCGRRARSET